MVTTKRLTGLTETVRCGASDGARSGDDGENERGKCELHGDYGGRSNKQESIYVFQVAQLHHVKDPVTSSMCSLSREVV